MFEKVFDIRDGLEGQRLQKLELLWPPCVADAEIIFLSPFFFLSSFFPRLISTVADWMSTILPYIVWP